MESDPAFVKEIDAKAAQGDAACKAAALCLQAMRSVICSNGCAGSAAAYFAGAVTTLQRHLQQKGGADTDATTAALLMVLRKALPNVSAAVAASRINDIVAALSLVLKAPEKEELVRQALSCLAITADLAFDASSRPNRKVLKPIFSFLGDPRSAVRHRAQLSAVTVLKRSASQGDQQTLEFASQHIASMLASARPDKKMLDEIPARHAVALLKATASAFSAEQLSGVCEALLSLPAKLGQHPVSIEAFQFLAAYLGDEADGGDANQGTSETQRVQVAAKVLQGLLIVPINLLNVAYAVAYVQALAAAIATLTSEAARDAEATAHKLAGIKKLFGLFVERDPSLLRALREHSLKVVAAAGEKGDITLLEELLDVCRPLLGYECKAAWPHELPVIGGVFDAIGAIRTRVAPAEIQAWTAAKFSRARELVKELVQIRDKARGGEMNVFGKELTECLGSAVAAFGPQAVLSVAELQLLQHPLSDRGYEQLSRSWILMVLRDSCKRTSLALFSTDFMPLASMLRQRATEVESSSPVNAKKYRILLEQVWAVLPAFCDEPIDLSAALLGEGGKLAKQLVTGVLQNEPEFRDYVWIAFARLCKAVHQPPSKLSEALKQANSQCLRTLSMRVMPEMFTAYVKAYPEGEGQDASRVSHSRQLALDTVSSFARLADPGQLGNLFKQVVQRLLKATVEGESADKAPPLADIANALVPLLPPELLELVLKVFTPMLSGANAAKEDDKATATTLQKAAYRAVRGVVKHPAAGDDRLGDATQILEFWSVLRDCRQTCEAAALKSRLLALEALLDLMQKRLAPRFGDASVKEAYLQCLTAVLPEIMFHLRDQSTSVREAARECLHTAATTAIHQELQTEIVTLLSAGLAGLTPQSKASAVDALSRLLYEHSSKMLDTLRDRLVKVVLLLLEDREPRVWRAALKFVKVVVYVVPRDLLGTYLPQIMKLFKSQHMATARMLIRKIIERLVKVLPEGSLEDALPKAHLPLLHYVQRQLARRQRPKAVRASGGDDEEDEDEDADMEDTNDAPRQNWASFQAGDDAEAPGEAGDRAESKGSRKRGRGTDEGMGDSLAAPAAVQSLLDAWEAESGSDAEGGGGGRKRKRDAVAASTWIREDQDAPLDFMSADAAHSVLTVRPPQMKRRRGAEADARGATNKADALRRFGLRFAEDGRLVVDEEKATEQSKGEDAEGGEGNIFTAGEAPKRGKALSRLAEMRASRAKAKAKARLERRTHIVKGLDSFKPGKKKASGDATRKGSNLEPYAFVRLNPKVTKEKFKNKAAQSFERVVQGVKKGVLKGRKAKARDKKHQIAMQAKKRKQKGKVRAPGTR